MKKLSLLFVFILCCIYLSAQVPYEETPHWHEFATRAQNTDSFKLPKQLVAL